MSWPKPTIADFIPATKSGTWNELRETLRALDGWAFRGCARQSWSLATSLERSVRTWQWFAVAQERRLIDVYRQAIRNYVPSGQIPEGDFGLLASMQHHGAPTRLLDVTRSPYIAAYFAIEEAAPDEPCQVWAFDESWFRAQVHNMLEPKFPDVKGDPVDHWLSTNLQPNIMAVVPAMPKALSPRQIAQQAVFLVSGAPLKRFEDNLVAMAPKAELTEHVRRFVVPSEWRYDMLTDLRMMNITRASLFPGLDGFAQSLRYTLVRPSSTAWPAPPTGS